MRDRTPPRPSSAALEAEAKGRRFKDLKREHDEGLHHKFMPGCPRCASDALDHRPQPIIEQPDDLDVLAAAVLEIEGLEQATIGDLASLLLRLRSEGWELRRISEVNQGAEAA